MLFLRIRAATARRLALALLVSASSAVAATAVAAAPDAPPRCDSTDSCLDAVERAQGDTRSLSARFVQEKHLQLLEEPLVSTGRFLFVRPDRVRLDLETPRTGTILIDGERIEIPGISARDEDAMKDAPVGQMFAQLGALFTGSVRQLEGSFTVTAKDDGGGIVIDLDPKAQAWRKRYRRVAIRFAGADLTPAEIRLEDTLGDRLDVRLTDVQRNQPVAEDAFRAAAPGGS